MKLRSLLPLLGLLLAAGEASAQRRSTDLIMRILEGAAKSAGQDAQQATPGAPGSPGAQGSQGTPEPEIVPVTVTDMRFGYYGYSVAAPQGEGWLARRMPTPRLSLIRRLDPVLFDPKTHSFGAFSYYTKLDKMPETIAEFVAMRQAREVYKGERFKVLKREEIAEARGELMCARYSITTEDSGPPAPATGGATGAAPGAAPGEPPAVQKTILEARGVGCVHPELRDWVVDIGYTQRSPNGGLTESLAAEGEQLVRSLRFGPLAEAVKLDEQLKGLATDPARLGEVRTLADHGYPLAQAVMGRYLTFGTEQVAPERKQGIEWLLKAAEQGNAAAQFNLGLCHHRGIGGPIDLLQAKTWYTRARQQHYANASRAVADVENAIAFYRQNAEKEAAKLVRVREVAAGGDPIAQAELASAYEFGRGLGIDMNEALAWYRKAAEGGNPSAQYSVGAIYDFARGVPQDDAEAARWYLKAGEAGSPAAQYNLYVMYRLGRGVARDEAASREWLKKAAAMGHPTAKVTLTRISAQ